MKRRAGYSLLEVLIAFAVMSLVLSAVVPNQALLLSLASDQEQKVLALDFAVSISERLGIDAPIKLGVSETTYGDWRVQTIVESYGASDYLPDLAQAHITISGADGRLLATLKTLVATQ